MSTRRLLTRTCVTSGACGLAGLLTAPFTGPFTGPLAAAHVTTEPDTAARGDSADTTARWVGGAGLAVGALGLGTLLRTRGGEG